MHLLAPKRTNSSSKSLSTRPCRADFDARAFGRRDVRKAYQRDGVVHLPGAFSLTPEGEKVVVQVPRSVQRSIRAYSHGMTGPSWHLAPIFDAPGIRTYDWSPRPVSRHRTSREDLWRWHRHPFSRVSVDSYVERLTGLIHWLDAGPQTAPAHCEECSRPRRRLGDLLA